MMSVSASHAPRSAWRSIRDVCRDSLLGLAAFLALLGVVLVSWALIFIRLGWTDDRMWPSYLPAILLGLVLFAAVSIPTILRGAHWIVGTMIGAIYVSLIGFLADDTMVAQVGVGGLMTRIARDEVWTTVYLSVLFSFLYGIVMLRDGASRRTGPLASALIGILIFSAPGIVADRAGSATFPYALLGVVLGAAYPYWLPALLYPVTMAWNLVLYRLDAGDPAGNRLRWHSAFWDEHQRLRLHLLDRHLALIARRDSGSAKRTSARRPKS
jgi:hypothetical protein